MGRISDILLMLKMNLVAFGLVVAMACVVVCGTEAESGIAWHESHEGALETAADDGLPLMVMITKGYCGACKALKAKFAADPTPVQEYENKVVMVHLEDDKEPADPEYAPDGGYIPRIIFVAPDGTVLTDIKNEGGNPKYGYFYPTLEEIAVSLEKVSDMYPPPSPNDDGAGAGAEDGAGAGAGARGDGDGEDVKIDL